MGLGGLQLTAQGCGFLAGAGGLCAGCFALGLDPHQTFTAATDFVCGALALLGVGLLGGLGLGRDASKGGLCLHCFALGGGQLAGFGFGQLLALLGLVALGAQSISIGAQLGRPAFDFLGLLVRKGCGLLGGCGARK